MKSWTQILQALTSSISAHNSQPFFIETFANDFKINVNSKRLLPYADPLSRDLEMSLGALLESLKIILAQENLSLDNLQLLQDWKKTGVIATFTVKTNSEPESLSIQDLHNRFSYRGTFLTKDLEGKKAALEAQLKQAGFYFSSASTVKAQFAKLFDDVNYETLQKPHYLEELFSWMRLSSRNPNWIRDGLNSESMNLASIEVLGASLIMRPSVFQVLAKMGLVKPLISESPQIKSAHFIVAITGPKSLSSVEQGRVFLRKWVELSQMQIFGAPLSLLTEQESTLSLIHEWLQIPKDQVIINVLRCGVLNPGYKRYAPARLPIEDLIMEKSPRV